MYKRRIAIKYYLIGAKSLNSKRILVMCYYTKSNTKKLSIVTELIVFYVHSRVLF